MGVERRCRPRTVNSAVANSSAVFSVRGPKPSIAIPSITIRRSALSRAPLSRTSASAGWARTVATPPGTPYAALRDYDEVRSGPRHRLHGHRLPALEVSQHVVRMHHVEEALRGCPPPSADGCPIAKLQQKGHPRFPRDHLLKPPKRMHHWLEFAGTQLGGAVAQTQHRSDTPNLVDDSARRCGPREREPRSRQHAPPSPPFPGAPCRPRQAPTSE